MNVNRVRLRLFASNRTTNILSTGGREVSWRDGTDGEFWPKSYVKEALI